MVADCGTLIEASDALGRTPSAISMTLKHFTNELGGDLFETDRKSTLTPLGHFVLEESRRVISDFDASMLSIHRYAHGRIGTVRVAAVPSTAMKILPEAVRTFHEKTPNVRIELRDNDSRMVISAVQNGSVDFGIASLSAKFHDLNTELLLEEPFGVVCLPTHPLAQKNAPIEWHDLNSEKVISNDLFYLIKNQKFTQLAIKSHIHIHNNITLINFVQNGFGLTLLPRSAAENQPNLSFLPLKDKTAVRQLFFISRKHHQLNVAANTFKKEISHYIKSIF